MGHEGGGGVTPHGCSLTMLNNVAYGLELYFWDFFHTYFPCKKEINFSHLPVFELGFPVLQGHVLPIEPSLLD